ncbi:MAG: TonB-dependent receptor [bacterium]
MSLRKNILLLLVFYLLAFSQVLVMAQGPTTGRIEGTVKDQNGAVIPGAEVKVINKATANERTTTTNEVGHYATPLLQPGLYRVSLAASGFNTAIIGTVHVLITETTLVNADLTVKGVNVNPVVVRVAPLIHTDGPQLGRAVDSRFVSELPLASRNFTQILSLSPGVATYLPDSTGVGRNTQTISVNGARMTQNNVQINGIDANTMGTSSAVNLAIPAPETIQEFKVQTSLYDATFGRSGGGNVQIVTKSGGNDFHGSLYEYFRNDALNANNPFLKAAGVSRPVLKRNAFGGTVGGPIKKEKAFFFASYQGTRESNGASILNSVSSSVLVAQGLTDDRSEQTLLQTFKPTLTNGQPATSINPVALALLNVKLSNGRFLIPTPQANGRYSGSAVSRFRENQFNANVDYRVNEKNWLAVKFFFANAPSTIALPSFRGTGPNVPGFGTRQAGNVRVFAVQDVHIFSPRTFNELRLGYNRHRNLISPSEPVKDSDLGIKRSNSEVFPGLGLIRIAPAAGGVIVGTQTNIAPAFPWVATIADTLAITRGKQLIRTGGEFRFNEVDANNNQFSRGQVDFLTFNNFLIGASSVSTFGNGIADRKQRATDYNFFIQDDWKTSRRLTLNLGLRYELDLPPYDRRGRISTFDPSLYRPRLQVGSDGFPIGPPVGGIVQAGNVISQYDLPDVPNVGKRLVRSIDPNNFAPRIGFAYSLFNPDRLVVRGGYGIFYSRSTFQYISFSTVPPTYVIGRKTNPQFFADPFFPLPPQSQFPTLVPGISLSGTVPDRGIRTPYFHQYNASLQYQVIKDTLLEVAYVGTSGRHLFRSVAINQARLASSQQPIVNDVTGAVITTNTPQNAPLRAPYQGVDINGFFQNQTTAQSSYNSLQMSLTRRLTRGLQLLGSYTYAKSLDNASGTGGGAGIVGLVNPGAVADTSTILGNQFNNRANRGVSDFDRTHRFALSYIWDVPKPAFAKRSTAGRLLLSDWQVAGIIVAMSGLPVDIVDTGAGSLYGLSGGGNPLARPNWAPDATRNTVTSNVPGGYFFNPFAFARPIVPTGQVIPSSGGTAISGPVAPGTPFGTDIGNVGRNVLRGPRQTNVDFSVIKRFPFGESRSLEFRTEVFNLFNHVNLANPISDLNAVQSSGGTIDQNTGRILSPGNFGRIISTSNNPRLIQFALKVNF